MDGADERGHCGALQKALFVRRRWRLAGDGGADRDGWLCGLRVEGARRRLGRRLDPRGGFLGGRGHLGGAVGRHGFRDRRVNGYVVWRWFGIGWPRTQVSGAFAGWFGALFAAALHMMRSLWSAERFSAFARPK